MLSIVIPILNEEKILTEKAPQFTDLSQHAELIFVDGNSTDQSVQICSQWGKVMTAKKGRASQMNAGAQNASHPVILFLHADNMIALQTLAHIESAFKSKDLIGGCLSQHIDHDHLIFRLIEAQGNIRARISKEFYGDQGIFVRKDVFARIGGFPDIPIFEDVFFTRKLRKAGRTTVLAEKITVSPRRWEKHGIMKTMIMFNTFLAMLYLGFSLDRIKALYEDLR